MYEPKERDIALSLNKDTQERDLFHVPTDTLEQELEDCHKKIMQCCDQEHEMGKEIRESRRIAQACMAKYHDIIEVLDSRSGTDYD